MEAQKPQIMISYSWIQQPLVQNLVGRLQASGFDVWVDYEQMSGDILDAMAKAVETSALVVYGVSDTYKNSKNCRLEATYAFKRGMKMIPIMMEGGYDAKGWLGCLMGMQMYFEMETVEKIEQNYENFVREINRMLEED